MLAPSLRGCCCHEILRAAVVVYPCLDGFVESALTDASFVLPVIASYAALVAAALC